MGMCTKTVLAKEKIASVEACSCGCVQVHLGPFTVRLDPGSFVALSETLAGAASAFRRDPARAVVAQFDA